MKIAVVNSDRRMQEVYFQLAKDNEALLINEFTDFQKIAEIDALVLPVKGLTSTGSLYSSGKELYIPEAFWSSIREKPIFTGIRPAFLKDFPNVYYYMEDDVLKQQNAVYTAEGTLYLMMDHTSKSIKDISVDVIGYGVCGKEIVRWLRALGIPYRIVRRSCEKSDTLISVEEYRKTACHEVIINTSISKVIDRELLERWSQKPLIIDIATPDVIDYAAALSMGVRVIKAGNLPEMIAYESSGKCISEFVRGKLHC